MSDREYVIGALLREKKLTLGVVESATGGLISHLITNVPGSSKYFKGSITTYANAAKRKLVGVKASTLTQYGAVSPQVAVEMADGGRKVLVVDICISDTGIAGPGSSTLEKGLGLFYMGLAHKNSTLSRKFQFEGTREEIKQSAAQAALNWLKEYLVSL
ncbi:MAG: CinA family protein [Dehalococcoidales bacterium]|nr:CinA family protein [Dehalococcoidales bacterium]